MKADEAEEFAVFVRARSASLFRTALLLTGDRDQADDLVQSALERVCRHWSRARSMQSPEAYARRILVNLVNDRWRWLRGRREVPMPDDSPAEADPYRQLVERDELIHRLHALPVNMRTVLVLRYYDDLSDESIADLMNTSTSTVRSQAARGLAKLRAADAGTKDMKEASRARL